MPAPTDGEWNVIIDNVRGSDCVPFLGAGASLGFDGPSLPTAGELARELAQASGYQGADVDDFLRVCQYYELWAGRFALRRAVIRRLTIAGIQPGEIHRTLASFPVTHVLTTNYDRLMERAFEVEGKRPQVIVHNIQSGAIPRVPRGTVDEPIVYKLHGTIDDAASMICTEDDVVEFLARLLRNEPGLPSSIQELFEERSFLFIGYGLRDWNIRVLIRTLRLRNRSDWTKSFAVQRRPSDPRIAYDWDQTVMYWDRRENIKCFDAEALSFARELHNRYRARMGLSPPIGPGGAPTPTPVQSPAGGIVGTTIGPLVG